GETGSVVPPKDPKALAQAWAGLIQAGPDLRRRLGEAARAHVQTHFAMSNVIRKYEALYTEIEASLTSSQRSTAVSQTQAPVRPIGAATARPSAATSAKPKILFVDNNVNSFYSYRIEMARATRDSGFDVHVACPTGKAVDILKREGFTFH